MADPFRRLVLWSCLCAVAAAQTTPSEVVRQAELAFARQGAEQGIRAAFLAWLLPEARVFRPAAATAQAMYGPEPGDPGHLIWHPEANGAAASGELAWSTGPWTYAAARGEAPVAQGHFLSLWRKQPDGAWRVIADIGVPHAAPGTPIPVMPLVAPVPRKDAAPRTPGAAGSLRQAEAALAQAWRRSGSSVLSRHLGEEARVLRPRHQPLAPGPALDALLAAEGAGEAGEPQALEVAASGDLGWTWGETRPDAQGRRASFLRIWERDGGGWKVRFDVRLPHPAPAAK